MFSSLASRSSSDLFNISTRSLKSGKYFSSSFLSSSPRLRNFSLADISAKVGRPRCAFGQSASLSHFGLLGVPSFLPRLPIVSSASSFELLLVSEDISVFALSVNHRFLLVAAQDLSSAKFGSSYFDIQ